METEARYRAAKNLKVIQNDKNVNKLQNKIKSLKIKNMKIEHQLKRYKKYRFGFGMIVLHF